MDYTRLVDKSLLYIEEHLQDDMKLEDISDVANLSLFHFHRIFSSATDYTLKDYIRKRRLSCASRELVFNHDSLQDIARKYQFQSLEAFIRAFKKEFNKTPGTVRKEQAVTTAVKALNLSDIRLVLKQKKEEIIMEPKILELDEMDVIGIKCTTTMKENTIPQLWDRYNKIHDTIPNKVDSPCLGICVYIDMDKCTEDTYFDYIAATCVSSFDNIPEGMMSYTIPKGKFACFTHKGSLDTLDKTYNYIFGVWANETECEIDQRDQIELYDDRFKWGQPESEFEILIPIK